MLLQNVGGVELDFKDEIIMRVYGYACSDVIKRVVGKGRLEGILGKPLEIEDYCY